jgi:hypothetical protein
MKLHCAFLVHKEAIAADLYRSHPILLYDSARKIDICQLSCWLLTDR